MDSFCPSIENLYSKRNGFCRLVKLKNLSVGEQLRQIQEDNLRSNPTGKTGIYVFHCKANDMIYIGSAMNLERRRQSHIEELRNDDHVNWKFTILYYKYGLDNLNFYVLEFCPPEYCKERELYYIKKLDPEINIVGKDFHIEGNIYKYMDRVEKAQDEWRHSTEGFNWHRKRIATFYKMKEGKEEIRQKMKIVWAELIRKGMMEDEIVTELLEQFKFTIYPDELLNKDKLLEYLKTEPIKPQKMLKPNKPYNNKGVTIKSGMAPVSIELGKVNFPIEQIQNKETQKKDTVDGPVYILVIVILIIILLWWLS